MTFWELAGPVLVVMIVALLIGNAIREHLDDKAREKANRLAAAKRYADRQLRKLEHRWDDDDFLDVSA